jgi:hypothetical protein
MSGQKEINNAPFQIQIAPIQTCHLKNGSLGIRSSRKERQGGQTGPHVVVELWFDKSIFKVIYDHR